MIGMRQWMTGLVMVGVCSLAAGLSGCGASADGGSAATDSPAATATASSPAPDGSTATAASSSSPMSSSTSAAVPSTSPPISAPSSATGSSAPQPSTAPTTAPPTSTAPSTSTSRTTSTSTPATIGSTAGLLPGGRLTLTGTVESGVEPSCLILEDEKTGRRVNITGGNRLVRVGARVTVVGRIRTDLMSYCQQGAIFEVITATKS